jgi:ADP-ribosylglycohydrolase
MRAAPVGLYFSNKQSYTQKQIDRIGAEVAAITHGHELGYLPAAALVHIISLLVYNDDIPLLAAVKDAMAAIGEQFANATHLDELLALMQKAIDLASSQQPDIDAIRELGAGWVAEETLAIAIYCAIKYANDFDKALIAAVNHDGDSDSTGAVTGNILGAYLGLDAIPAKYIHHLELKSVILEIADDLYHDCQMTEYGTYHDEIWARKYINCTYAPTNAAGA